MWKELLFVGRYSGSSSLNFRVSPDKEASTELSWKKVGRQWMLRSGADKAVEGYCSSHFLGLLCHTRQCAMCSIGCHLNPHKNIMGRTVLPSAFHR